MGKGSSATVSNELIHDICERCGAAEQVTAAVPCTEAQIKMVGGVGPAALVEGGEAAPGVGISDEFSGGGELVGRHRKCDRRVTGSSGEIDGQRAERDIGTNVIVGNGS